MKFDPLSQRLVPDAPPPPVTAFKPWRPPWYPYDNNPWTIVSIMSNNIITNYSAWVGSLPPGELLHLIAEHRKSVENSREAR